MDALARVYLSSMPHPHRGSLRGGDTHLSFDLTLTGSLELLVLGRTDGQKKWNQTSSLFMTGSISHVQTVFSQSLSFFFFLQKKTIGLEAFHFVSLV